MQPPEPSQGYVNLIGAAIGAAAVVMAAWIKSYWNGRRDGDDDEQAPRAKQIIMESAELANVGDIQKLIRDLMPRLEQLYEVERTNRAVIESTHQFMTEFARVLRKLEQDIDFRERLRQERLMQDREQQSRSESRERDRRD